MKNKNLNEQLFDAAKYNSVEVAELLIEQGADVNVKNKNFKTPLHMAADDKLEVIELLIKHGGK